MVFRAWASFRRFARVGCPAGSALYGCPLGCFSTGYRVWSLGAQHRCRCSPSLGGGMAGAVFLCPDVCGVFPVCFWIFCTAIFQMVSHLLCCCYLFYECIADDISRIGYMLTGDTCQSAAGWFFPGKRGRRLWKEVSDFFSAIFCIDSLRFFALCPLLFVHHENHWKFGVWSRTFHRRVSTSHLFRGYVTYNGSIPYRLWNTISCASFFFRNSFSCRLSEYII